MLARSSTLSLVAAVTLMQPSNRAAFTLESSGAVTMNVAGDEARHGLTPDNLDGGRVRVISLGATRSDGALGLYTSGDALPQRGEYPVRLSWKGDDMAGNGRWFHACFIAGSPERPLGVFHGESGWVRIIEATDGRIVGEFEIHARGFLAANPDDEDQWVTVRGTFTSEQDSTSYALGATPALRQ